jgi:hypothetical protein
LPDKHRPDRNLSHQAMVQRLQEEVTTIVLQYVQQLLSEGLQRVVFGQDGLGPDDNQSGMQAGLDAVYVRLALAAGNTLVLDTILREADRQIAATDNPAIAAVRRLASLKLP